MTLIFQIRLLIYKSCIFPSFTLYLSTIMFVVILCIILISNAMESRSYRRDQKALRGEGV